MAAEMLVEASKSLERVQQFDAEQLPRRDVLGSSLSFDAAVEPAKRIIGLFQQLPIEHLKDLPTGSLQQIRDLANSFYSTLQSILQFSTETDGNPAALRQQYIESLKRLYDDIFNIVHPLVGYLTSRQRDFGALERAARAAVQSATDQAGLVMEQFAKDREEVQRILNEVRQAAAEQGVSQQAIYFKDEAEKHETSADKWRTYTVRTAIGLGGFAAVSVFLHKIPWITPTTTYEAVQVGLSKLLIFGVIAYMVALCARNFLSHKHNGIVNRHRQNALLTFKSLTDAASGEDRRDVVLTHAAACIFSPQDTGYTRASGGQDNYSATKLIEVLPKLSSSSGGSS
ncbi:MAG: hypothetical protein M9937_21180 [Chelatococcus sp.]|nr:hypothetical protein [Chelatococcus sp.]MCO5078185.1 hypothetical protein [Chelatococcus sp.]